MVFDGNTKWRFVLSSLERLQSHRYGPMNVLKVVKQLVNPQEFLSDAAVHDGVLERVNDVLSFYGLAVDEHGNVSRTGEVATTLRKPSAEVQLFDSRAFHA